MCRDVPEPDPRFGSGIPENDTDFGRLSVSRPCSNIDERVFHEEAKRDGWTAARLATTLAGESSDYSSCILTISFSDRIRFLKWKAILFQRRRIARKYGTCPAERKKHLLVSAAVLLKDKTEPRVMVDRATLVMRSLNPRQIRRYLDLAGTGILGSVGCYHIEGLGPILFENVEGDVFTIRGLPLHQVLSALRDFGYDPLTNIHRPIRSPVNL